MSMTLIDLERKKRVHNQW